MITLVDTINSIKSKREKNSPESIIGDLSLSDVIALEQQRIINDQRKFDLYSNAQPNSSINMLSLLERNNAVNQAQDGVQQVNPLFLEDRQKLYLDENVIEDQYNFLTRPLVNMVRANAETYSRWATNTNDFVEGIFEFFDEDSDFRVDAVDSVAKWLREQPENPLGKNDYDDFFFNLGVPDKLSGDDNFINNAAWYTGQVVGTLTPYVAGSVAGAFAGTAAAARFGLSGLAKFATQSAGRAIGTGVAGFAVDGKTGAKEASIMSITNDIFSPYSKKAQIIANMIVGGGLAAIRHDSDRDDYSANVATETIMNGLFAMFGSSGKRKMLEDANFMGHQIKTWAIGRSKAGLGTDFTDYVLDFHNISAKNLKMKKVDDIQPSAVEEFKKKIGDILGEEVDESIPNDINEKLRRVILSGDDAKHMSPRDAQKLSDDLLRAAEAVDNPKNFQDSPVVGKTIKDLFTEQDLNPESDKLQTIFKGNVIVDYHGQKIRMSPDDIRAREEFEAISFMKKAEDAKINKKISGDGFISTVKKGLDDLVKNTVSPDNNVALKLAQRSLKGTPLENYKESTLFAQDAYEIMNLSEAQTQISRVKEKVKYSDMNQTFSNGIRTYRQEFDDYIYAKNELSRFETKGGLKKIEISPDAAKRKIKTTEEYIKTELGEDGLREFKDRADNFFTGIHEMLDKAHQERVISSKVYNNLRGRQQTIKILSKNLVSEFGLENDKFAQKILSPESVEVNRLSSFKGDFETLDSEIILEKNIKAIQYMINKNSYFRNAANFARKNPENGIFKIPKINDRIKLKNGKNLNKDDIIKSSDLKKEIVTEDGYRLVKFKEAYFRGKKPKIDELSLASNEDFSLRNSFVLVDEDVMKLFDSNPVIAPKYAKALGWISGSRFVKTFAVTADPTFGLRSYLRDNQFWWRTSPFIEGKSPVDMIGYMGSAFKKMPTYFKDINNIKDRSKGKLINEWLDNGGSLDTLYNITKGVTRADRLKRQGVQPSAFTKAWGKYVDITTSINSKMEIAARLHAYDTLKQSGLTPRQAVAQVQQQLNFRRKGNLMYLFDELVPFMNVSGQVLRAERNAYAVNPSLYKRKMISYLSTRALTASATYYLSKETMTSLSIEQKSNKFILPLFGLNEEHDGDINYAYFSIPIDENPVTRFLDSAIYSALDIFSGKNKEEVLREFEKIINLSPYGLSDMLGFSGLPPILDILLSLKSINPISMENMWYGDPNVNYEDRYTGETTRLAKLGGETASFLTGGFLGDPRGLELSMGNILKKNPPMAFAGWVLNGVSVEERNSVARSIIDSIPSLGNFVKFTNNFNIGLKERIRDSSSENKIRVIDTVNDVKKRLQFKEIDIKQAISELRNNDSLNSLEKRNSINNLLKTYKGDIIYERESKKFGDDFIKNIPSKSEFRTVNYATKDIQARWYLERIPDNPKLRKSFKRIAHVYGFTDEQFFYNIKKIKSDFSG